MAKKSITDYEAKIRELHVELIDYPDSKTLRNIMAGKKAIFVQEIVISPAIGNYIISRTNICIVQEIMIMDKVTCAVCGNEMKKMTVQHLRMHGIIDFKEYREQYPNAVFTSDYTKIKMSASQTGKKQSIETIEKLRLINIGRKHTDETRKKMSDAHKGKIKTKKHCENLSKSLTGNKLSKTHIDALKRGHADFKGVKSPRYGVPHTNEAKIKISCMQQGIEVDEFDGFLINNKYCNKFNENLKQRVRYFFGNVCFLCGKTQEENRQKLSVHHVNYDKMICCNDVEPLFVPLCHICHSKTGNKRMDYESYFEKRLNDEYNSKCFYTIEEFNHIQEVSA